MVFTNEQEVAKIVEKWTSKEGPLGLSEIKDEDIRRNTAIMLENIDNPINEASQAMNTTASMAAIGTIDGTQNNAAYQFKPITLALVRRTMPELFANKVVGVQAMNGPVGLAYALRILYASGNSDNLEAGWEKVPEFAGYTGSTSQTSGVLDGSEAGYTAAGIYDTSASGQTTSAAEAWQIGPSGTWPQLKSKIDQKTITAVTRKLAASFSLESAQDLRAMHGVDIEKELLKWLQYEITAELDRELLYRMKLAAVNVANGGEVISAVNVSGTAMDGRWSQEKFGNIVNAIIYQAERIGIKTRISSGNFVIVSPAIATALQSLSTTGIFTRCEAKIAQKAGVSMIGSLNGTIDVYRDTYAKTDYAMVGYKGPGVSDAGIIYSPYITGLTNRAIDPSDFSPRIGVMQRYAITDTLLGSGRYYRLVPFSNVSNLILTSSATNP